MRTEGWGCEIGYVGGEKVGRQGRGDGMRWEKWDRGETNDDVLSCDADVAY